MKPRIKLSDMSDKVKPISYDDIASGPDMQARAEGWLERLKEVSPRSVDATWPMMGNRTWNSLAANEYLQVSKYEALMRIPLSISILSCILYLVPSTRCCSVLTNETSKDICFGINTHMPYFCVMVSPLRRSMTQISCPRALAELTTQKVSWLRSPLTSLQLITVAVTVAAVFALAPALNAVLMSRQLEATPGGHLT